MSIVDKVAYHSMWLAPSIVASVLTNSLMQGHGIGLKLFVFFGLYASIRIVYSLVMVMLTAALFVAIRVTQAKRNGGVK